MPNKFLPLKLLLAWLWILCGTAAHAQTYDFNFTFTNPGTVMTEDGLGVGTRTFSGKFTYNAATGQTSFLSGSYGNANGSMSLGASDVTNVFASFTNNGTPALNIVTFDYLNTLPGATYDDDLYSYVNRRLTWDNGSGAGQFETVSNVSTTYIQPAAVPEIDGFSLVGVAFILATLLFGTRALRALPSRAYNPVTVPA